MWTLFVSTLTKPALVWLAFHMAIYRRSQGYRSSTTAIWSCIKTPLCLHPWDLLNSWTAHRVHHSRNTSCIYLTFCTLWTYHTGFYILLQKRMILRYLKHLFRHTYISRGNQFDRYFYSQANNSGLIVSYASLTLFMVLCPISPKSNCSCKATDIPPCKMSGFRPLYSIGVSCFIDLTFACFLYTLSTLAQKPYTNFLLNLFSSYIISFFYACLLRLALSP